jgi:CHAD domain-containing protein
VGRVTHTELVIRQRIAAVARALPSARKGDADAVHQARVATRRLREALPLVGAGSDARKVERSVRRLTRTLGPVRELDVALHTLAQFDQADEVPHDAAACLAEAVTAERAPLFAQLVKHIDRLNVPKLRAKAVKAARKATRHAPVRGRDPQRIAAARGRAARRAARLQGAIEAAAGIYIPERLHVVRIAVKKLRYSLEVARELSGSRAVARIRTLKRAQDLLGRLHDLEVLIARTRGLQASAKAPDLRLSAHLDGLVRRLETECRQLHGRYMASRSGLLKICERVQHDATSARARASAA